MSGRHVVGDDDGCRQQQPGQDHRRRSGSGRDVRHGDGDIGARDRELRGRRLTSHVFQRVQQATWSSPVTNRLLLEAGFGSYFSRYGGQEVPGNLTRDIPRIVEQCTAGCAEQRRHPEPDLRLAELGEQSGAAVARGAARRRTSPARTA